MCSEKDECMGKNGFEVKKNINIFFKNPRSTDPNYFPYITHTGTTDIFLFG